MIPENPFSENKIEQNTTFHEGELVMVEGEAGEWFIGRIYLDPIDGTLIAHLTQDNEATGTELWIKRPITDLRLPKDPKRPLKKAA